MKWINSEKDTDYPNSLKKKKKKENLNRLKASKVKESLM